MGLFDKFNYEPVVLYNQNGEPVSFKQEAHMPMDGHIYVVLTPLEKMEGVNHGECLIYEVTQENGQEIVTIVEDAGIISKATSMYQLLVDED